MDNSMDFGTCLNQLLSLREWSASKLAKEINIDSSYLRKWVRCERVPSLKSNYTKQIAASIGFGLELSSKKAMYDDFLNYIRSISKDVDESKSLEELIEELLISAQLFSLTLKPQICNNANKANEKKIINILANTEYSKHDLSSETLEKSFVKDLKDLPSYIEGRHGVTTAILSILQAALDNEIFNNNEIFITYQSREYCFDGNALYYDVFKKIISELLQKDCQIHYLCRFSRNINRSLKLVSEIIEWAYYKGGFLPAFFTKYGITTPPSELIVAKGIGSLFCFAAENDEYVDRAFFYHEKEAIEAMYNYAIKMYKETTPLIKVLPTEDDYFKFVTSKDRQSGDFFAICYDLYSYTIPMNLWEKYLHRSLKSEAAIKPHMERIGERAHLFYEDVKKYKVRHVYRIEAINHLVKTASYFSGEHYQIPTPPEVLEHLRNIICLLKTYENFEIALLSENQNDVIPYFQWEVKGANTVVMSTWNSKKEYELVNIAITEETVAGAFHDYFLDIWDRINPKYRDKAYVISWLEDQADWFEKNML